MTAAVPTIWLMLLNHMESQQSQALDLAPRADRRLGLPARHDREVREELRRNRRPRLGHDRDDPIGSICAIKPDYDAKDVEKILDVKTKQGAAPFTVEMKIVDDSDNELPWDGKNFGRLKVKGVAVAKSYFKGEGGQILDANGFFDTGDVATIDPFGNLQITDRSKDVIKSGGEWISSIDLENLAVGHPKVMEAAVIGIRHPKWDERPLLIIIPKKGESPTREEILGYMDGKIAKWWMPDDVVFVNEIPHTATGKILKTALRDQFKEYTLPSAVAAAE